MDYDPHLPVSSGALEELENGRSVLYRAAWHGLMDVVRSRVACKEKLATGESETLLCNAARHGHTDVAGWLLKKGANANSIAGPRGKTVLMVACEHGHAGVVRFLLYAGADISIKQTGGRTPLVAAAAKGHVETVRCIVEVIGVRLFFLAHVDEAIAEAVARHHTDVLACILEISLTNALVNPSIDMTNTLSNICRGSLLDKVCSYGYLDMVRPIVPRCNGRGFQSALRVASEKGLLEIVQYLVSMGADVRKYSDGKATPLSLAVQEGHMGVANYLAQQTQTAIALEVRAS